MPLATFFEQTLGRDVLDGLISRETARDDYRVALAADGTLDRAATAELRAG